MHVNLSKEWYQILKIFVVFLNRITKQVKPGCNFSDIWDYPS